MDIMHKPGLVSDEEAGGDWLFTDESGCPRRIVLTQKPLADDDRLIEILASKIGGIDQLENLRQARQASSDMRLRVVEDPEATGARIYSWNNGFRGFGDISLSRSGTGFRTELIMQSGSHGCLMNPERDVVMIKL